MSAVSETIVREFFELHGFLVRQHRKHTVRTRQEETGVDFLVVNPRPVESAEPLPFVLEVEDLPRLSRALVVVKGWHTETFSAGRLSQAREIFRFVGAAALKQAMRALGEGPLTRILVVPSLPVDDQQRDRSVDVMRANGVEAVISFPTLLASLITSVEVNRDYQKSDLLQVLRILKTYELFRDPQLELFKSRRPRAVRDAQEPG
jgi:hypothetical protein